MIPTFKNTLFITVIFLTLFGCSSKIEPAFPDNSKLATEYFQEDTAWYLNNIPFFECSDKEIEQVYYYRWKLFKSHLRSVGSNDYVVTEFINHVGWDKEPFCTINAASMHHIYEGRWLRDQRYMDGYINNLYLYGGNNRQYSESVADAAYARYLVNGDSSFIQSHLDSMKSIYEGWKDHWDSSKNMYYIPAMPDATEYTIASIDASGGKDGFGGGDAFRPTINSYMYGNAMAISKIAAMKGDENTSRDYLQKVNELKSLVEKNLWNDSLQHFTDRYKKDNEFVHYWDFIRGRELAGFAPWYFNLPDDNKQYAEAWKHLADTAGFLGKFGFRTNEPSYQYYFKQYVFNGDKPGSQWNGPSWPYQSSQVLTGLANLLNNYHQDIISNCDYVKMLKLFTRQHILPDGTINLVENYDPNKGGPIVYFYWSNHYNHSTYNNLIISGLCGIHPSDGDTLEIRPLTDSSIHYFYLDRLNYHGHDIRVIYDKDGKKYNSGKGLTVYVDGNKTGNYEEGVTARVPVGNSRGIRKEKRRANMALNILYKGYPAPSASVNTIPDSLFQAIDGRIWYYPEISNRWTSLGSTAPVDWYSLDFGQAVSLSSVKTFLVADGKTFFVPDSITMEYREQGKWKPVEQVHLKQDKLIGNTKNEFTFPEINTGGIKLNFYHSAGAVAVSEIECY